MGEKLKVVLQKHRHIGIDTSIFIYHFEAHPTYLPLTTEILDLVYNVATALNKKATLFVTNDSGIKQVRDIEVVLLDEFL